MIYAAHALRTLIVCVMVGIFLLLYAAAIGRAIDAVYLGHRPCADKCLSSTP